MKGGGGDCVTWDDFVYRAFVRPLRRFLEACDTVVLAFDNYAQVCPPPLVVASFRALDD